MAQFICRSEKTVAHASTFLLIADLLVNVREQILGLGVPGFGVHQFVEDFIGFALVALIEQ